MEQPHRARHVLSEAMRLRADDGNLLLGAARIAARLGDTAEAQSLLSGAKGKVRENDWLRAAAEIAEIRWDAATALRWTREILKLEPLTLDAHRAAVRLLSQLEGTAAALVHLESASAAYPHHYGLKRMLLDWNCNVGPEAAESAARELLRLDGADASARRELALALAMSNRAEEALQEANEAARIEPLNSHNFCILGHIYHQLQQPREALRHFRLALELSVDNRDALNALLALASTDTERKEELAFIRQQLIRQVVTGDGLLLFVELARPFVEPEALLGDLRQAHRERPDLWHAWAALVSQLCRVNRLDEALEVALEATKRLPHLPRIWLELAMVHQCRKEHNKEIAAAERAFEINPSWGDSAVALAEAYERIGQFKSDDARRVYERALQHSANDPQLHARYGDFLWRQGLKQPAFDAVQRAITLEPGYEWAWDLLRSWAGRCREPERTEKLARALSVERPNDFRVWLALARVLSEPNAMRERLNAVERALELRPRSTGAWDLKAELLAIGERFDEAVRTCKTGAATCPQDVHVLHARHAWIEARRGPAPEAIRLMRTVLAENATYVWGWYQLAQWLAEQNQLAEAALALDTLLRLRLASGVARPGWCGQH